MGAERPARAGVAQFWGEFAQGGQHKAALEHAGMGQLQLGGAQDAAAVEQQVQVQGARSPVDQALAAVGVFDAPQGLQEFLRGEGGPEGSDRIEEKGLVEVPDRGGFVDLGARPHLHSGYSGHGTHAAL